MSKWKQWSSQGKTAIPKSVGNKWDCIYCFTQNDHDPIGAKDYNPIDMAANLAEEKRVLQYNVCRECGGNAPHRPPKVKIMIYHIPPYDCPMCEWKVPVDHHRCPNCYWDNPILESYDGREVVIVPKN